MPRSFSAWGIRQNDGRVCVGNLHSCTTQYFISDMQGSLGGGEIAREGKQMKAPPQGRMLFPQHTDLAYHLGLGISDPRNKQSDNRVCNEWSIEPLPILT